MTLRPVASLRERRRADGSTAYAVLWRDPRTESIADTIERLRDMYSEITYEGKRKVYLSRMTQRFKIETSEETDLERAARYKRDGLEVVTEAVDEGTIGTNDQEINKVLEAQGL